MILTALRFSTTQEKKPKIMLMCEKNVKIKVTNNTDQKYHKLTQQKPTTYLIHFPQGY